MYASSCSLSSSPSFWQSTRFEIFQKYGAHFWQMEKKEAKNRFVNNKWIKFPSTFLSRLLSKRMKGNRREIFNKESDNHRPIAVNFSLPLRVCIISVGFISDSLTVLDLYSNYPSANECIGSYSVCCVSLYQGDIILRLHSVSLFLYVYIYTAAAAAYTTRLLLMLYDLFRFGLSSAQKRVEINR